MSISDSHSQNCSNDKAKTIFLGALEIEASVDRKSFIDDQCGDNASLRQEVDRLLAHQGAVGSFLESPPPGVDVNPTVEQTLSETIGNQIGPYKLLQRLGEGGMGVVYLAERQHPVKQRVALKIIRHGMDSKKFIARFEAERQALAMMDHPNIAKILDAGCTEYGRPYFAMELVKGIPITTFCDDNRFDTSERLELFVQICRAVQHAHQRGIIHRDLKPSNVLVALYDDKPVPKVIDFGVAKATNQQLTEKTLFTEVGSILGTWEYMSPEQAVLNQLDVDTRTDVYSLGVLLYELLTGETPLDRQRLREAQIMETLRMIREDEPPKPSTRVSCLAETATATAAYRKSKPDSLAAEIRGDLDWIVMTALAKERARRYDSASRLAEDIQRFLNHDLVEARPPSTWYQLRKFYERNRRLALSVTTIAVVMTIVLAGAIWGLGQLSVKNKMLKDKTGQLEEANALAQELIAGKERQNALLKEQTAELEILAHQYREVLVVDLFSQAASGDALKTAVAITTATNGGVAHEDLEMIKGLVKLYAGRPRDALVHLRIATEVSTPRVAATGLLAMAYNLSGEFDRYSETLSQTLDPQTPMDHLFLGQALINKDFDAAIKMIRKAIRQDDSPLARSIYAHALNEQTYNTTNRESIWDALEQIKLAKAFMADSPFVLESHAHINLEAAWLESDRLKKDELLVAAGESALKLGDDKFSDHPLAHMIRAMYFDTVNESDAAVAACKRVRDAKGQGWVLGNAAVILYKNGQYGDALDLLRSIKRDSLSQILLGILEALEDPHKASVHFGTIAEYAKNTAQLNPNAHVIAPEFILAAGGQHGRTRIACNLRLKSEEKLSPWETSMLRYLAGGAESELLDSTTNSSQQSHAYFLIGVVRLSQRSQESRESGTMALRQAEQQVAYGPFKMWAVAILSRIDSDPEWPFMRPTQQHPAE